MSRKKAAKRSVKRQPVNNSIATMHKIEKDFLDAPAKLATHLNKEISALKQKENKLKQTFSKVKAQAATSEKRIKAASHTKNTASGKKQLNAAKKAYSENLKNQQILNKQLAEISKMVSALSDKQAKLVALRKHINLFDKEWAKNAKKLKANAKAKVKAKAKTTRKSSVKAQPAAIPAAEPLQADNFDADFNDSRISDNTEMAS